MKISHFAQILLGILTFIQANVGEAAPKNKVAAKTTSEIPPQKPISASKNLPKPIKRTNITPKTMKTSRDIKTSHSEIIEVTDGSSSSNSPDSSPSVNRLFANPVFASGLSSGADAINHSIDSLMSSLFYRLLDNNLKFPLTGSAGIHLGLTRDVYNARNGAYVVVDRMGISPEYSRELYRFNNIPVVLGASQSTEVFDIYLRTDPLRIADNKQLPMWRASLNNWFGLLPLLEIILPPSFNVNEMYDPFNRVEVPFTFPLSIEATTLMDIGAIKAYSVSGGINLGLDLANGIRGFKEQVTTGPSALDLSLPFTVFRTGSYRINVLKKDANTMWVGFVDQNRLGEKIETKFGKAFYLLANTIPYWKGIAAPVFPVDFGIEEAIADAFGRVYSYDLRESEAKTAFVEAVHGNFAPSQISWLRAREDKKQTGVSFFYTKKERRFQTSISTGNNVYLTNKRTARTHSDAVIEITDATGRYHILEAVQDVHQTKWDLLTGSSDYSTSLRANLFVRKVVEQDKKEGDTKSRFEFLAEGNLVDIAFSISLTDKFVEVENLTDYLEILSRFSQLKLDGIPAFAVRETSLLEARRKEIYFQNDSSLRHRLHVTPTHLGKFEGYGAVRMTNDQLMIIAGLPRKELWTGLCKGFKVASEKICMRWEHSLFWRNLFRTGYVISQPMRLVDFRWRSADTVDEIETAVAALRRFAKESNPEAKQAALRSLFATEYPLELVEGLLLLSDLSKIPRSVELETQPKGHASEEIKTRFRKIGGMRFKSEKEFPPPVRYDTTRDIDSKFEGANISFDGIKPIIKKISLYSQDPPSLSSPKDSPLQLMTKVSVSKINASKHLNVYVKLQQAGQIQLAKLKLIEDVVEIPFIESFDDPNQVNFLLPLSGPQSPLTNVITEEALALGGSFRLSMTVSSVDRAWSDEKVLEFRVEKGQLRAL